MWRLLGIGLLVWIASHLHWRSLWEAIFSLELRYIAIYIVLYFVLVSLRITRLNAVLRAQHRQLPYIGLYRATIEPLLMGTATPGRFGEITKIGVLKEYAVPLPEGLVAMLLERVFDLIVLTAAAMLGIAYFAERFHSESLGLWRAPFIVGAAGLLL